MIHFITPYFIQWQQQNRLSIYNNKRVTRVKTLQPPVHRKDHSCTKEIWVLVSELAGDVLVGLQSPGYIVSAAI